MDSYSIHSVSVRTGLTEHVLRAWERRYSAVRPLRAANGHRRYSADQVKRLELLARARSAGHSIGTIVDLPIAQLASLGESLSKIRQPRLDGARLALETLDETALVQEFDTVLSDTGRLDFIDEFVFPFISLVRAEVSAGSLRPAHLSFAQSRMREFLSRVAASIKVRKDAPSVIISGFKSLDHEAGLIGCAIHATEAGWKPMRFSPGTPTDELAFIAVSHSVGAVVYSLLGSDETSLAVAEATLLRRLIPPSTVLMFGGRMESATSDLLVASGLERIRDMDGLRHRLQSLLETRRSS